MNLDEAIRLVQAALTRGMVARTYGWASAARDTYVIPFTRREPLAIPDMPGLPSHARVTKDGNVQLEPFVVFLRDVAKMDSVGDWPAENEREEPGEDIAQLAGDVVIAADLDPDVRPMVEFEADPAPLSAIYDAVTLTNSALPIALLDRVDALVDSGAYTGTGFDADLRSRTSAMRAR